MTASEQPDTDQPPADPHEAYPTGSVKQDPETKAVALRTGAHMPGPWLVATVGNGGHFADPYELERILGWPDLAEVAAEQPAAE